MDHTPETIAIALPAHNEGKSITRTLSYIFNSNFENYSIEVYIGLSGCTDDTKVKVEDYIRKNPNRKLYIIEGPEGKVKILKQLDYTIEKPIIVFMDSDCCPESTALLKVYTGLKEAPASIDIVSGNVLDKRYINKSVKPINLIDSLNRVFWQRSGRKIINGPLFAARKGVLQSLPSDTISDDTLLSVLYWNRFINVYDAIINQGSAQSIYEIVRYRRNFQSAYKQIRKLLEEDKDKLKVFEELIKQFDIKLQDKNRYWPNIPYSHLVVAIILQKIGNLWGDLIKPTWSQTTTSKDVSV